MINFINENETKKSSNSLAFYTKLNEYKISRRYRSILKNLSFVSNNMQIDNLSKYFEDEQKLNKENNIFYKNNNLIQLH